jgi:hypothetical protein
VVVICAKGADPYLRDASDITLVGDLQSIGRELRVSMFWLTEEDGTGNEGTQWEYLCMQESERNESDEETPDSHKNKIGLQIPSDEDHVCNFRVG